MAQLPLQTLYGIDGLVAFLLVRRGEEMDSERDGTFLFLCCIGAAGRPGENKQQNAVCTVAASLTHRLHSWRCPHCPCSLFRRLFDSGFEVVPTFLGFDVVLLPEV